jgi:two-component system, OmpR family, KDP operon response regulator KdpE
VPRLLLVEDNPLLLRLYQALLEEGGHQVRAAGCVDEALSALGVEAPEVLVMDLRLPELEDGLRLLRAVPESATRVIVISGWTADLAEHPERLRVNRVLSKPVRLETLLASVRELTEKAGDSPHVSPRDVS